jgi:hypothetical protein
MGTPRVKPQDRKRKGGSANQPFVATPKQRAMVRALASGGWTHDSICVGIINPQTNKAIDKKTLRLHFRAELDGAAEEANSAVVAALFNNATKSNNVAAQIFWLKTRAGWREPHTLEVTGKDGGAVQTNTTGVLVVPGISQDLEKWGAYVNKTMVENQAKADAILREIKTDKDKVD